MSPKTIALVCLVAIAVNGVYSHGRMVDPPSRSSAWRYGFKTPHNYNDHELSCVGNSAGCGVCGGKGNEFPNGVYAKGLVVTRTYKEGESIQTKIELTANHKGSFVYKICPASGTSQEVSQGCLDSHVVRVTNSPTTDRFTVPNNNNGMFTVGLKLPSGMRCDRCVLQWTYTASNNWGNSPQEIFRNCADIRIVGNRLYDDLELKANSTKTYVDDIENDLDQLENELELD